VAKRKISVCVGNQTPVIQSITNQFNDCPAHT